MDTYMATRRPRELAGCRTRREKMINNRQVCIRLVLCTACKQAGKCDFCFIGIDNGHCYLLTS